jgi:hypothetical protein
MQFALTDMKLRLLDQRMTILGVDPKDPVQIFQLNTISQNVSNLVRVRAGREMICLGEKWSC